MKNLYAYSFTTALAPAALFRRLREAGTWMWIDRDSDRWGDYVSTVGLRGAIVKVLPGVPAAGRCAINVRFESDAADAAAQDRAVRATLLEIVLPSIGAGEVSETDYLE